MRILHLFSDFRWTGPAEPVVNLVRALRERGHDVRFACRAAPDPSRQNIRGKAAERGVDAITDFRLNRYFSPRDLLHDLKVLPRYLDEHQIDLVHTHLSHDHFVGGISARRAKSKPLVVRTNHKAVPLRPTVGNQLLMRRSTDAYLGFSRGTADQDAAAFGFPEDRVFLIQPTIDLSRFDPTIERRDIRSELNLKPDDIVAGVVARVQRHRRFNILMQAMKLAVEQCPNLRLVVIGRGTHIEAAAKKPARDLGLDGIVLFPGYRSEDFVDYLAMLDFKVFLMPGSDGTCRAVREAMAMSKPVVAAKRGILPELVPHEQAGLIVDPDTPENLAAALVRMASDTDLRTRLGAQARQRALEVFDPVAQTDAVAAMYEKLLGARRRG